MRPVSAAAVCAAILGAPPIAAASDACSTASIRASADVAVSDGSSFRIESIYHTPDHASIRHSYDDGAERVVVVEGPLSWVRTGSETSAGSAFDSLFALGHQYHAFILYFDDIVANTRETASINFRGSSRRATSGDYPYGGVVHRINGPHDRRPAGFVFDFGENARIEVTLSNWRPIDGIDLPYRTSIDDGERVFEYRYTAIDPGSKPPLWFYEVLPGPDIDEVSIHRLHRKLLAAHCLGDANLMAELSAPAIVSANRGALQTTSNADLRSRFAALFGQLDYREYHDLVDPVIEVSASGDIGWVAVEVRAVGEALESGQSFDTQWAWLMAVRKHNGAWRHVANASNRVE